MKAKAELVKRLTLYHVQDLQNQLCYHWTNRRTNWTSITFHPLVVRALALSLMIWINYCKTNEGLAEKPTSNAKLDAILVKLAVDGEFSDFARNLWTLPSM